MVAASAPAPAPAQAADGERRALSCASRWVEGTDASRPLRGGPARTGRVRGFAFVARGPRIAFADAGFSGTFPARPRRLRRPACVEPSRPLGVARDGAPILPAYGADGTDRAARDGVDACGGSRDGAGRYVYLAGPDCLDRRSRRGHSRLVGYARDGHGIFGRRGARRLDACGGHSHRVLFHGRRRKVFHFHVTRRFPYTLGCFRARPARDWRVSRQTTGAIPPGGLPILLGSGPDPVAPPREDPAPPPQDPAPPPEPGVVAIATEPPIEPGFDRSITDYAVRCGDAGEVSVDVAASRGATVAVDGRPARGGEFSVTVPLQANQRFRMRVGDALRTTTHHVRCLPPDFPPYTAAVDGTPQAAWYFVGPFVTFFQRQYAVVFDARGVPVWWKKAEMTGPFDFKLLQNGNVGWFSRGGDALPMQWNEVALDGALEGSTVTAGTFTDFHEYEEGAGGTRYLLSYRVRDHVDVSAFTGKPEDTDAAVYDAEVQELDEEGDVVWSWNSANDIALSETGRWWSFPPEKTGDGRNLYDIVHANSVEEDGDGVIVSMRHTDAVYRIDKATGDVDWKLGGSSTPASLAIVGDGALGAQHDARVLPDGTLTLQDNGTATGRAPRALRYELDTTARTARVVETVTDPLAPSSFCCGSSRRMPGGNWVSAWGGTSVVTEQAPDGSRPFVLTFGGEYFTYRANPVLPGVLSAQTLRNGMDAQHPR